MIKTSIVVGGAFAAGSWGGGKIAATAGVTNPSAQLGIKVATGVAAFVVLSMFIR